MPLAVYLLLETQPDVAIALSLVLLAVSRRGPRAPARPLARQRDEPRRRARRAGVGALDLDVELAAGDGRDRRDPRPERRGQDDAAARARRAARRSTRGSIVARRRRPRRRRPAYVRRPGARPVGVVFQDYLLFPHLTVRENVAFGLRSRGMRAPRGARRSPTSGSSGSGSRDRAPREAQQLSGGQAQRVALARALATEPAPAPARRAARRARRRRAGRGPARPAPPPRVVRRRAAPRHPRPARRARARRPARRPRGRPGRRRPARSPRSPRGRGRATSPSSSA